MGFKGFETCNEIISASSFAERLCEIKEYTGFSLTKFASKIGLSRNIVERMLQNDPKMHRYPTKNELEIIASNLGTSLERLIGDDFQEKCKELDLLIKSKRDLQIVMDMASRMDANSLTVNEKLLSLGLKSRVFRNLKMYADAEQAVSESFELAIKHICTTDQRFVDICNEYCQLYFDTNRPSELDSFISGLEQKQYFVGNLYQQALMAHYKGICAFLLNDLEGSQSSLLRAAEFFYAANAITDLGRVESCLANIAYLSSDYARAENLYKNAIKNQANDAPYYRCVTYKDYVRLLLDIGDYDKAIYIIGDTLDFMERENLDYSVIKAKLLLMKGDILNRAEFILECLACDQIDDALKLAANLILTRIYVEGNEKAQFHLKASVDILEKANLYSDYRKGGTF